ncbi:class I SAM-dependent methyltransferase [Helicobacter cinaedi]|uniref:class I SAM-dependent methyltransferase n=3 Tax=Helicobacter cinaedi TaxID=213 RepID=UPI0018A6900D|nr:class I SAM-dependent methyltransferase [Helicobacter cinaedi]QOQ89900.1 class I SAM-dependent methyltransferase [Helicobacter cinaedi]
MQKNITQDNYLRTMKADKNLAKDYYAKSINKTEQQKALESLLIDSINKGELDESAPYRIADLACGGGTLSYHLSSFFPNASFVLLDYNEDGLELAKEINAESKDRMEFIQGDLRDLPLQDSSFDLVFCWQTLSWVDKENISRVMQEIVRILKPKGRLYASSLFNTEFDVDLYTTICDRTRPSSYNENNPKKPFTNGYYNTYCKQSIIDMCDGVRSLEIVPFYPQIDFKRDFSQRGIGSFTLAIDNTESNFAFGHNSEDYITGGGGGRNITPFQPSQVATTQPDLIESHLTQSHIIESTATPRLTISAGMLLNWGILIIIK